MKPYLWHSEHPEQDFWLGSCVSPPRATSDHTNKDAILYKPTEPDGLTDHHAVSLQLQAKLFPGPLDYATSTRLQQSLQVHKRPEVLPSRKGGAVPSY